MKIIPAIDIIGGKTVRLERGRYDRKLSYDIDPVDAALKWESLGAELIHVVDLDGAREGRPVNLDVIDHITKAVKTDIEAGGGYRRIKDIEKVFEAGVARVIIGSRAFEDKSFAEECVRVFSEKIIFSVDVSGNKLGVRGWIETVDDDITADIFPFLAECGVKEIIYTDIQSDGMLTGPNIKALENIFEHAAVKVISAGGVKTIEDIRRLRKLKVPEGGDRGVSGVIIGRALYDGTIDLKEAIDACKKNNTVS